MVGQGPEGAVAPYIDGKETSSESLDNRTTPIHLSLLFKIQQGCGDILVKYKRYLKCTNLLTFEQNVIPGSTFWPRNYFVFNFSTHCI